MGRRRVVKHSRGEKICGQVLRALSGEVYPQYRLGKYYYDYMIVYNDNCYLVEYDGIQHFRYTPFIHKTEKRFLRAQRTDVDKTSLALLNGYHLMRISYHYEEEADQRRLIEYFLRGSQQDQQLRLYVSELDLYQPLLQAQLSPLYQAQLRDLFASKGTEQK